MDANTTIIISPATLVLAIFGASWLNQRSTERLLEQMEKRFDAKIDLVLAEIKRVDNRLEQVEKRLDNRLEQVEKRLDRIERQLESIFKPVLPK